jgi:hypothetical protein
MGLWDNAQGDEAMKVRYARFKGIKFGVIPENQQGRYLRDLLPFEQGLWYGQEEIGRVGFATFKLDVHDPKPFCHKPISYPPKARAWLNDHLKGLERMGIVRRVNMLRDCMPTFTSSVVLVPQGQSG